MRGKRNTPLTDGTNSQIADSETVEAHANGVIGGAVKTEDCVRVIAASFLAAERDLGVKPPPGSTLPEAARFFLERASRSRKLYSGAFETLWAIAQLKAPK
jgi:hypothetical protein